jgi:hypothetical protein
MSKSVLSSLKFTALPKKVEADPIVVARAKLIARLNDQKSIASDPNFSRTMTRWRKNTDGKRETVKEEGKPKPSWFVGEGGIVTFFVRKGKGMFLDFNGKGQCAIALKSENEIPALCDTLIPQYQPGKWMPPSPRRRSQPRKRLKPFGLAVSKLKGEVR